MYRESIVLRKRERCGQSRVEHLQGEHLLDHTLHALWLCDWRTQQGDGLAGQELGRARASGFIRLTARVHD